MKILYICGAYKPRASANGLCSDNVIQQLIREGHSVTALVNAAIGCDVYSSEDGLDIYRVKPRLFLRLNEYGQVYKTARPGRSKLAACVAFFINKFELLLTAPWWPRVSFGAIRRFRKTALRLCRTQHYDVVISVYTPIEALLAGYAVKKEFPDIRFIPYFLDSLSGGYGPKYFSEQTIRRRGLKIEQKVFTAADKIVIMQSSQQHHNQYNAVFAKKLCVLDIPMLKSPERDYTKPATEVVKLLFVGSIAQHIRNPETLIKTLLSLDGNIECEFVGAIDCSELFEPLRAKYGTRLIFTDFIPHEQLAQKIGEADVLLNIGNLVSTMVPSKIFEYMSYGKPIISTYDIDDEPSARYLREYPLALLLDGRDSETENAKKMSVFLERSVGKHVDFDQIREKFVKNTPQAFTGSVL